MKKKMDTLRRAGILKDDKEEEGMEESRVAVNVDEEEAKPEDHLEKMIQSAF